MLRKKILSIAVALAVLPSAAIAAPHTSLSAPLDMVIADEQRLIDMLKKSGKIAHNASMTEAEVALKSYLKSRQQQEKQKRRLQQTSDNSVFDMEPKVRQQRKNPHRHPSMDGKLSSGRQYRPENMVEERYEGETREGRVLAILMEFPDFLHNSILPEDTGMYYDDYNQDHYRQILFGDNGWIAPNGHHANSFTQFYQSQSGESYSLTGDVAGWYMASQPAAYYGNNIDGDAASLVREGLAAVGIDPSVDLSQFDIEDRYDLDGDGDLWEPDGLVDHVMVFHSSVGEEAGGGQIGEDAIWAHRSNLRNVFAIEGSTTDIPYWGGLMAAYDYTVAPIDSAVGVISHEYGHDLGLPDEYDTNYSGKGEPVSYWSMMSSGSWAGEIGGTQPSGFSAYAKEMLQENLGGNWLKGSKIDINDVPHDGVIGLLDQAVSKGTNFDAIRIDLPQKQTVITTPVSGEYAYFSGADNDLQNEMWTAIDLTDATSAVVKFKTWYDIEIDYDYAYLVVETSEGKSYIEGNLTTNDDPNDANNGNGITGQSDGWIDAEFDLSAFAGQNIQLGLLYQTDVAAVNAGMYIDDINVETNNEVILQANADDNENEAFVFSGFNTDTGIQLSEHYYLLEWRTHQGIDSGLAHINVRGETMRYEEGLLIWYVDGQYRDNWVGIHPGDGFLGVVDMDQTPLFWSDGEVANTTFQIHDAALSINRHERMFLDLDEITGKTLRDSRISAQRVFKDHRNYVSTEIPDAGRNVPQYGLNIRLLNQSRDKTVAAVYLSR
ncbi:immune inhibitor A domain-containing protein [Shewanella surugensis]|uniref:Immune inhibitor A n=1 Tax=Shewanella surugensis TaxID=212020 RepID=A0ABT0LET7_9GAMM|nr:immune inhibitor A domain-containing protein [Shewanella surugensis]MCL1126000.1 immune inhibitor A [Shewanella surugensis]